jgi:hypothetical protein
MPVHGGGELYRVEGVDELEQLGGKLTLVRLEVAD